MKTLIAVWTIVVSSAAAQAQGPGAIHFDNRSGNDARVFLPNGAGASTDWIAQLYFVPEGTSLAALHPIPITTFFKITPESSQGYVRPIDVTVPVFPGEIAPRNSGEKVTVVMRVFKDGSFENAPEFGESNAITIVLGGGFKPPVQLVGLKSFTINANSVVSVLPQRFVAGETLAVRLKANPTARISSYAVADRIPAGWTVTKISDSGRFDPVLSQVEWGPFADHQPRELQYEVRPGVEASELVAFEGEGSFDNQKYAITGDRQSQPGSRIALAQRLANGHLLLTVSGPASAQFTVWSSPDLQNWKALGVTEKVNGSWQFIDTTAGGQSIRFYRASSP